MMSSPALSKILTLPQLIEARTAARAGGQRIVQCHGCFDIVHPGHIRHLRQARALGDLLLVSITGDGGINKGAGRPLIPEELRAENLAALDCVDYVHIDPNPTALSLLEAVQPDVYIKGKEYETNDDPRFRAEREAVERAGGRVVFSSGDVVFSSTALIAALEQNADPYHQRLTQLSHRPELHGSELFSLISAFRNQRVVIVGESIVDTYILCAQPRVASESPVMTLRPVEARHYDGGAAIVARHCAAMGARPVLVTPVPDVDSPDAKAMIARLTAEGVEVIPMSTGTPLPEKQRFLVGSQKVMKLDLVQPLVLDAAQQARLVELAAQAAGQGCDAAIITDFGLGLFTPRSLTELCRRLRPLARVLAGDVSGVNSNLRAMQGVDLLCPSESELRDAMQLHGEGLPLVAYRMMEELGVGNAIVTLGADGLIGFSPLQGLAAAPGDERAWTTKLASEHIPALAPAAVDALGCGDSLLAAATLALASGAGLVAASYLGAVAASVQVQRLGNLPVSAPDLRRQIARTQSARLTYAGGPDFIEASRGGTLLKAS
jgi:rfaE bifunctional protein kinase chain/domain/rfaE bifunctional protein nucleotidyltransferase chain/domain